MTLRSPLKLRRFITDRHICVIRQVDHRYIRTSSAVGSELAQLAVARVVGLAPPGREPARLLFEPQWVASVSWAAWPGDVLERVMEELLSVLSDGECVGDISVLVPAINPGLAQSLFPNDCFSALDGPPQRRDEVLSDQRHRAVDQIGIDVQDASRGVRQDRGDLASPTELPPANALHDHECGTVQPLPPMNPSGRSEASGSGTSFAFGHGSAGGRQGREAIATTGEAGGLSPSDPANGELEKLKMPPSAPTMR